jgi:hypothetical protein
MFEKHLWLFADAKPAATAAAAAPRAASVAAALQSTPELSTLLAAVTAAGISIPAGEWDVVLKINAANFVVFVQQPAGPHAGCTTQMPACP